MTPRAEKEPTTRPSDRLRGRVLLIADDRAQFVETLNDRGIDVFGVSNGTAAIVSLTRTRPHLVIADATTPGLRVRRTREDACPGRRWNSASARWPGAFDCSVRRAAMLEGAFDYFSLPDEVDLLIERTQQFVLLASEDRSFAS
jgi:DNA-binding NtrC family response regulator